MFIFFEEKKKSNNPNAKDASGYSKESVLYIQ
jgi:hypothetical protein